MAIKRVYYNGSSKIIKAICNAINDIIDSGGGGGSSVSITPTLSSGTKVADYEIDGVQDALYAPTQPTKTSDLTNDSNYVSDASYVHTDNNYTTAEQTKLAGVEAGAQANVQVNWNESDSSADDYIKNKPAIYNAVDLIVGDTNKLTKIYNGLDSSGGQGAAAVITFQTKSGTVAFLTDIPTKLSDLVDDVVSGNYLPLSGGTMTGAITINVANGLKFATCSQNTNPTYLLTMDTFASGGEVKYTQCSEVTAGAAGKVAGTKTAVGITAASGITLANYSYKIGNIVTLSFMTDPFTGAATWSNKSLGTVASGSRPQSVMMGHVSNGSWIGLIRVDTAGKITAQTIAGGAISSGYVAFNCCYVC